MDSAALKVKPEFTVRKGLPSDSGFIAQHWVGTFRDAMPRPWQQRMDIGPVNRFCYQHVEKILERAEVRIAGPADGESPDGKDWGYIYGCAVVEPPNVAHFVFVRPSWRKKGIAKALLDGIDIPTATITTWSQEVSGASGWILSKYKTFRYVPFYMREGDDERKHKRESRYG